MIKFYFLLAGVALLLAGFWGYDWYMGRKSPSVQDKIAPKEGEAVAYFAGGCFWCVESDYEKLPEVKDVVSGYMGGSVSNPSYEQVSSGTTGHRESVKVVYDPQKTTYHDLVLHLLRHTNPTDSGGSFYDRGYQYTSAIYYRTKEEKRIAEKVVKELNDKKFFDKPIITSIEPAGTFWVAEDYHQDYYKKNQLRYEYYRNASGRDNFIESVWGDGEKDAQLFDNPAIRWEGYSKPDDEELKKILSPIQYEVTQKNGTEKPFENEYSDNKKEGIYVDILSGEPLFSSTDKFNSGTGWPSFTKPISEDAVVLKKDYKLIIPRTEVRSRYADSHLGHVFNDGPAPTGFRYCMNSAALRFVPKEDLEKNGLGEYTRLFR